MPRPDEGLIHAWLDGQLPREEAEQVEHLVATDPAWEAAAAEARGLVAASSRILAALDDVPRGVRPVGGAVARPARRLPWWMKAAAAIVVIVGGSTLVMQRAAAPTVTAVPKATVPVAIVPVTPPAPIPVATPAAEARRDIAKLIPQAAAARAVPAELPQPQVLASTRERAEAPVAAAISPGQEARVVGGVSSGNAGGVQAQRVADQRAAAAPVMARMESPLMANKAANALTGVVVTGMAAAPTVTVGACYSIRDSKTSAATGIVMRGDKQVTDTLFLAPLRASSPMRGWIMVREDVLRGVLTTEAEGRGMRLVTAAAVSCTEPKP